MIHDTSRHPLTWTLMASIRSLSLRRKLPLLVSTLTAGALVVAGTLAYIEVRGSAIQAVEARLAAVTAELANASSVAQAGRLARDSVLSRSPVVLHARGAAPPIQPRSRRSWRRSASRPKATCRCC
jgi:hypothetical protein